MPFARFLQIVAAIRIRRFHNERRENSLASWMTRTIASHVSATVPMEKNKENKALKQAEQIAFDEIEQLLLGATTGKKDPHENENGSYERFLQMVGAFETRGRQL